MIPCPVRIANRYLLGDLNPPLGGSDSPCDLLHRIKDEVGNPKQKEQLVRLVENGKDLTNPQAHIVYDDISEKGIGKLRFRDIDITAHAQYRMDLRGVSVQELRNALYAFQKKIQVDKAQKGWSRLEDYLENETVSYTAPNKLKVVFRPYLDGRGRDPIDKVTGCKIITVYFEGVSNPKPPSESDCRRVANRFLREAFRIDLKTKELTNNTTSLFKKMKKEQINKKYLSKDLLNLVTDINRSFSDSDHIRAQIRDAFTLVEEYNAIKNPQDHKKWLKKSMPFFKGFLSQLSHIESNKVFEHTEYVNGIIVTYHFDSKQLGLLTKLKVKLDKTLKAVKKYTTNNMRIPPHIIVDLQDKRSLEGYYLRRSDFITITLKTAKKKNVAWAICHEIGHFVYDNFSSQQQALWNSFIASNNEKIPVKGLMGILMRKGLDDLTEYGVLGELRQSDPTFFEKARVILEMNKEFKEGGYSFTWESLSELMEYEGVFELNSQKEFVTPYASLDQEEYFSEFFAKAVTKTPSSLSPTLATVWSGLT